ILFNSSVDLLLYSVRLTKTCKGRNALRTALATAAPASVVPRDFNRFVPYQVRPRVSYTNSAEAIGVSPPAAALGPALGRLTQRVPSRRYARAYLPIDSASPPGFF